MKNKNDLVFKVYWKLSHDWDALEKRNAQLNVKAICFLHCVLDINEYYRTSQCETTKDIWRVLEITHEEINQVKEFKINILVHDYELFWMKDFESISEMFTRLIEIVNGLQALGKIYTKVQKAIKILRSLPEKWEAKVMWIKEVKYLTKCWLLWSLVLYNPVWRPDPNNIAWFF